MIIEDLPERIKNKITRSDDGCWNWTGATRTGYGVLRVGSIKDGSRRMACAHREVWGFFKGAIPAGLEIDHLCKNKGCVNPHHLEPVKPRINKLRADGFSGLNNRKTECLRGHPFDLVNTRFTSDGKRRCRKCYAVYRARAAAVEGDA
jgi:hypothetical protein